MAAVVVTSRRRIDALALLPTSQTGEEDKKPRHLACIALRLVDGIGVLAIRHVFTDHRG